MVEQKVCLETDPDSARALARAELARYMVLDNYRNCWLSLGFTEADIGRRQRSFHGRDGGVGQPITHRSRMLEHYDAGATHVCIQPVHPAGDVAAAKRTLEAFAPG